MPTRMGVAGIISQHVKFLRRFLANPQQVGAVAPSSRRLAEALTEPMSRRTRPSRILEVGAGTGAITRHLVDLLGPNDHLDICELQPGFCSVLERDVLSLPAAKLARSRGRIQLLTCRVEQIDRPAHYDFIISGLPLNSFDRELVEKILDRILRNLAPEGVFSYFEYVGLGRITRHLASSATRRRTRAVRKLLKQRIQRHQFARRTVLWNLPPAYARHWHATPATSTHEGKGLGHPS
ncbi:MAG: methyltransferase domain-containing protein [Planctomycetes bacterium]|nr:methyltransferase domain-containing protein [Planctomycetota bacterium]